MPPLVSVLRAIAREHRRFGWRRLHVLLRGRAIRSTTRNSSGSTGKSAGNWSSHATAGLETNQCDSMIGPCECPLYAESDVVTARPQYVARGSDMAPAPKARLHEAQRARALTTFVSTQMAAASESAAKRDQHKFRPIRFDAQAVTRPFRFQHVTPGAKPLCTTQSASPDWRNAIWSTPPKTRSAPSHTGVISSPAPVNAERLLPPRNRRPFEVWPVLAGFQRDLGSAVSAQHVRCGSHSPKLRLCQS